MLAPGIHKSMNARGYNILIRICLIRGPWWAEDLVVVSSNPPRGLDVKYLLLVVSITILYTKRRWFGDLDITAPGDLISEGD